MIEPCESGFRVVSSMTISQARALLAAGEKQLAGARGELRIDLSAVTEADSAALAVMLGWIRAAADRSMLRFIGVPPAVAALADMYGVAELLPTS